MTGSISLFAILTMLATLAVIMAVSVVSGKRVSSARDFATGGRSAGTLIVAGAIMGTLVGGSSTIGTAELAESFGLSAWWFTLGSGLGCLMLALFYIKAIRRSPHDTIMQAISAEFGTKMEIMTSALSVIGMLIMIAGQILAGSALLTSILPISRLEAGIIIAVLMAAYVIFGGVLGTGLLGLIKIGLLYFAVIVSAVIIMSRGGGFQAYSLQLDKAVYFDMFARGVGTDLGAGLSVILGVLSTQMYVQSIISAKSDAAARKGSIISAILIPPLGLGSVLIGMYMKLNFAEVLPANAFTTFVTNNMHPALTGVILAGLLLTIVGAGAGGALGISTIVMTTAFPRARRQLLLSRLVIAATLVICLVLTQGNIGSTILHWAFLSMALRATVALVPYMAALFLPGKLDRRVAMLSSVVGTALVIIGNIAFELPFDPLMLGIAASFVIAAAGLLLRRTRHIS